MMYQFTPTCGECANAQQASGLLYCHAKPPRPTPEAANLNSAYPVITPDTAACRYYRPAVRWNETKVLEPGVIGLESTAIETVTGEIRGAPKVVAQIQLFNPDGKASIEIRADGRLSQLIRMPAEATISETFRTANITTKDLANAANRASAKAKDIGANATYHPDGWPEEAEAIRRALNIG